jgi:PhoH-like ATPase
MDNGSANQARVYLPDTNVLINDPDSLTKLARGNTVVVPYPVVLEVDHLKDSLNGVGMAARRVARLLDSFQEGKPASALSHGIAMPDRGCLVFDDNFVPAEDAWDGFDPRNNDDRIICIARKWTRQRPDARVSLVTRDVAMRVKARPLGVNAEDYRDDKKISSVDELYPGSATIVIPDDYHGLLTDLHREGRLEASRVLEVGSPVPLLANHCCTIATETSGKLVLAIYKSGPPAYFRLVRKPDSERGIVPMNAEQHFALALLTDPDIPLVTLVGKAGSGKTLMALLAGYQQLREGYGRLMIYRPNIEIGQSLGYLPGSLEEKFAPWTRPVFDNLELVMRGQSRTGMAAGFEEGKKGSSREAKKEEAARHHSDIQDLLAREVVQIAPISHLRGRSIHDAFIIADEAQNMNHHEVKTLLTRSGQGTKIVFTGDPDQVDLPDSSSITNGLIHLVERFKGQDEFGHITMTTTVRSRLAALAANLL